MTTILSSWTSHHHINPNNQTINQSNNMNHVDQQKVRLRLCRTWHVFSIRTLDPSLSLAFVLHIISSDSSCEWSYFIIEISLKDHSGTKKQRQKSTQSPCSAARVAKNPCASTTCIWAHETDAFAEKKLPRLRRAECTNRVPSPSPKHHCDLIRIGIPSKLKKFEAWVASSYYSRQCAGVYCLGTPFGSRIGYLLTSSSFYHSGLTTNKNALGQTERWMENPQRWCIQVTNFKVEKTNAITGSIEVYKSILRCAHGISHAMPTNHEAIIIVLIFSLNIVALDICSSSQQTSQCCWQ